MKHLKPFLCLSVFSLLVGCTTVPETGRRQLMLVSPEQETQMGLQSFAQVKQQERVSNDPRHNARIERIGRRIAASVGRELPNAQWEFVVFESDQVNAFALPGGKVGVYTGLLKLADSDDEIASVIGHEIAHVTSRHGGERMSQQIAAAGGAALVGVAANDSKYQEYFLAGYGLLATGTVLKYSRDHETEADGVGLRFAAGAGYDPRAAITFWQKMAAKSEGKEPWKWMSTHPPSAERIANLQRLAPQYLSLYEESKRRFE
jgi:metalloendopeptidase OMA1, mitochondrial